jgi:hypothetical protein
MENITLNLQGSFIEENELKEIKPEIMAAQEMLLDRKGASSEMTGWLDCMYRMDKKELEDIKRAGRYIQENSQAFILLGIGGSYLGAKAAIEAVRGDFHNELCSPQGVYMDRQAHAVSVIFPFYFNYSVPFFVFLEFITKSSCSPFDVGHNIAAVSRRAGYIYYFFKQFKSIFSVNFYVHIITLLIDSLLIILPQAPIDNSLPHKS